MLRRSVLSVFGPFEEADGIVEHIVLPVHGGRLRLNLELGAMQSQVVAVVGPDHQPVTQKADRIAVGVFGRVYDLDPRHLYRVPADRPLSTLKWRRSPRGTCRVFRWTSVSN